MSKPRVSSAGARIRARFLVPSLLAAAALTVSACTAPPPPQPPSNHAVRRSVPPPPPQPPSNHVVFPSVPPVGSPDARSGTVRTFLYHLNSGPLDPAVEGPRRSVIVLNAWEHQYIAPLKAANPDVTVLVYKDLSSTRDYEAANQDPTAGGLNYSTANPAYFLLNRQGQRQTYGSYDGHVVMDAGHPGYQAAWIADVNSELQRFGWDGVFIDNVMWGAPNRIYPVQTPKYGNDWTAAYNSAIQNIGTSLHASGFEVYANMQEARLRLDLWQSRLQYLDGAMEEMFTGWGSTPLTGWELDQQLELIRIAESMGKTALLRAGTNSIGPQESARYAVAAYLMVNGTRAAVSHQETDNGYDASKTTYWREYNARLGEPLGDMVNSNGLYVRHFEGGAAYLNTTDEWRHVGLGRPMREIGRTTGFTSFDLPPRSGRTFSSS